MLIRSGRSRFTSQALPESDFPDLASRRPAAPLHARRRRAQAPDRQDAVRHLHRGDALLPQRHLSAHARESTGTPCCAPSRPTATASRGSRRRRRRAAAGMPGVIVPRKTVAEVQKLLDDAGGDVAVELSDDQDALHASARGADLEADRRHLPGLPARHPDRQRQAASSSTAAPFAEAVDRVSTISSRARPRREAGARRRPPDAVGDQSRFRPRHRGARGRLRRRRRSRSASTPATCSTSPASSTATRRCSSSPIPARRR